MFIGHISIALAAKRFAPRTSFGTLFMASQFVDLLWPIFLLLGLERVSVDPGNTAAMPLNFIHYPYTHSLLAALAWGMLLAAIYFSFKRYMTGTITLVAVSLSHWLLDAITHRPDLPLYPGGQIFIGLGLWNSIWGTILFEGSLFLTGISVYLKATRAKDATGKYAFWTLMGFILMVYTGNLFGPPPPPDQAMIAIVSLSTWLLVVWAYWVDRHRSIRAEHSTA